MQRINLSLICVVAAALTVGLTPNVRSETILFDLGTGDPSDVASPPLFSHWNNISNHLSGVHVVGAVDTAGRVTSVNYNAVTQWSFGVNSGVDVEGIYGSKAQKDSFFLASGVTSTAIDIEGLPTSELYSFRFFGSRDSSAPRQIDITINGTTKTLEAAGNVSDTVVFSGVVPDSSNKVRIDCQINAGSGFAYLGVIEINGIFPSVSVPDPNATAYYVSPNGADFNPGTLAAPFRSIDWARDTIGQVKQTFGLPPGGITVYLRGGRYFRTDTFTINAMNSGEADKPIVYRGYPGEEVRLIGGLELDPAWFSLVNAGSPVWSRLDTAAQGNLMQVDLGVNGITDYGVIADNTGSGGADPPMELNFNGDMMQLGRWPNSGFELIASAPNGAFGLQFGYSGTRPERWSQAEDPRAFAYWHWNWWDDYLRMTNINTGSKVITVAPDTAYGIRSGQRWYALNLLEEIDTPGEWYLNRSSGILYFWPPSDINSGVTLVSTLRSPMVQLQDASYIAFRDIIFEVGRDGGIAISGGNNNLVSKCTMRSLVYGAAITGTDSGVDSCEVFDVKFGITMNGGDRNTLTPANLFATNNHIHDWSRWDRTYAPAVSSFGCGNRIAHNLMHDAPHLAISYNGNDHVMEFNEIHDVVLESSDAGAIYSGRQWDYQGIMIRNNFIYNVVNSLSSDIHGVYMDDMLSGHTIFGNVFYNMAGIAVLNNGGRDNIIDNNVFANCNWATFASRRGVDPGVGINCVPGSAFNLLEPLQGFNYQNPPWSDAYPRLVPIPNNCTLPEFEPFKNPEGCELVRNIGFQNGGFMKEGLAGGPGAFSYYTIADNIENQDPLFVDENNLNLALQDNSPAYTIPGFQEIPFAKIGPLDQGDLNQDGRVDLGDFAELALAAQTPGSCTLQNQWCQGADLDWSGEVGLSDLTVFSCCSWLVDDEGGPPGPDPNQNLDTAFIENWDYTPDTPLGTLGNAWIHGHLSPPLFIDSAIVTNATSLYSAGRYDSQVGNFLMPDDVGSADNDGIYLNHTDYSNALQQGPVIRLETSVWVGGANSDIFVGLGSIPSWAAGNAAFDLQAERFQFTIHDATGGTHTDNNVAEYSQQKWWNVRVDIDPAANGGDGSLDFFYKEPAETVWRQSAALSGLNLQLTSDSFIDDPYTEWTDIFIRVKRTGTGFLQDGRLGPVTLTSVTP
jgi:hypothetical protein